MDNFFYINQTNDKQDQEEVYKSYTIRETSGERKKAIEQLLDQSNKINQKMVGPSWVRYSCAFSLFCGVMLLSTYTFSKVGFSVAFQNAPILFFIGVVLILYGAASLIYLKINLKKVSNSEETIALEKAVEKTYDECMNVLHVPSDAKKIDILFSAIKFNDEGEMKELKSTFFNAMCFETRVFIEDENVCFADINQVIALPKDAFIKTIEKEEKKSFLSWNKEEPYNSPRYKEYGIKATSQGVYKIKKYEGILINLKGVDYEIRIPDYDYPLFKEVLPLPFEKEIKE